MGEHKIVGTGPLLDEQGHLREPGWALRPPFAYARDQVKAPMFRLKEWDYYLVEDDAYAVCLTLSDLGYIGLISASIIDHTTSTFKTTSDLVVMPMGKLGMPASSDEGDVCFVGKNSRAAFCHVMDAAGRPARRLSFYLREFEDDTELEVELLLTDEPRDSMVIATPWAENPLAFYYNRKVLGMRARGGFRRGAQFYEFGADASAGQALGLLDWGRGVWTYDNTWYWAAAQGVQQAEDGTEHIVALNLGYGFGDTSAASENMVFVDGVAHKLGRVDFGIPTKDGTGGAPTYDYLAPWHMTDDAGRLDLHFVPELDRTDAINVLQVVNSDQHQVFGTLEGTVVLDDGTEFAIKGIRGAAEHIHNRY